MHRIVHGDVDESAGHLVGDHQPHEQEHADVVVPVQQGDRPAAEDEEERVAELYPLAVQKKKRIKPLDPAFVGACGGRAEHIDQAGDVDRGGGRCGPVFVTAEAARPKEVEEEGNGPKRGDETPNREETVPQQKRVLDERRCLTPLDCVPPRPENDAYVNGRQQEIYEETPFAHGERPFIPKIALELRQGQNETGQPVGFCFGDGRSAERARDTAACVVPGAVEWLAGEDIRGREERRTCYVARGGHDSRIGGG